MKLVSDAYRELGKTVLNIGQGVIIALLVALLLRERVSPWLEMLGLVAGALLIVAGISLIQKAHHTQKLEELEP